MRTLPTCTRHNNTDLFIAESVRMVAMGLRMFFKSQIRALRSSDPDTMKSPPLANTADVTCHDVTPSSYSCCSAYLLSVALKHVDLHGGFSEVPQPEGGIFRRRDGQLLTGMRTHVR